MIQLTKKMIPINYDKENKEVNNHIERSLEQEIKSHICGICYDLMKPPNRNPILLFPCGHTLCEECITQHKKTSKSCP